MIERLEYAEEDDKIGTLQTSGTLLMVSINKQLIEVIRGEISATKIVQDDWRGGFGFQRMKTGNAMIDPKRGSHVMDSMIVDSGRFSNALSLTT